MSKLLLYCTKAKMLLRKSTKDKDYYLDNGSEFNIIPKEDYVLNGKIVAECDFEVEKIKWESFPGIDGNPFDMYATWKCNQAYLLEHSCLTFQQLDDYLEGNNGYAIHIKNLHIFDSPKELSNYCYGVYPNTNKIIDEFKAGDYSSITNMYECDKAPKNMTRVFTWEWNSGNSEDTYVLIPVSSKELRDILEGEKSIIIRRKALKEMLNNE